MAIFEMERELYIFNRLPKFWATSDQVMKIFVNKYNEELEQTQIPQ